MRDMRKDNLDALRNDIDRIISVELMVQHLPPGKAKFGESLKRRKMLLEVFQEMRASGYVPESMLPTWQEAVDSLPGHVPPSAANFARRCWEAL